MIPAKVFFEAVKSQEQPCPTFKLNLVVNDLLYDELKLYHTKYLCVTATDVLTLQLYNADSQQLIGTSTIQQFYKLVLDHRTIEVKVKSKLAPNDITIVLTLDPVSAVTRKKNSSPKMKKMQQTMNRSPTQQKQLFPNDISFSQRDPLVETQQLTNTLQGSGYLGEKMGFKQYNEGDSLQSLAQQRQKILGELFGKFKRNC